MIIYRLLNHTEKLEIISHGQSVDDGHQPAHGSLAIWQKVRCHTSACKFSVMQCNVNRLIIYKIGKIVIIYPYST